MQLRVRWGVVGVGITMSFGGLMLLGALDQTAGWAFVFGGLVLTVAGCIRRVEATLANDPGPHVYVELDGNLAIDPDLALTVRNDGPGTIHDAQISSLVHANKVLKLDLIPVIPAGEKRIPPHQFFDQQMHHVDKRLEWFLQGTVLAKNMRTMWNDLVSGRLEFRPVKIPFTLTYHQPGVGERSRRHEIVFEVKTRRAYVRFLP